MEIFLVFENLLINYQYAFDAASDDLTLHSSYQYISPLLQ